MARLSVQPFLLCSNFFSEIAHPTLDFASGAEGCKLGDGWRGRERGLIRDGAFIRIVVRNQDSGVIVSLRAKKSQPQSNFPVFL